MNISEIPERVHFVGIGGVGQSALAQHLLQTGHKVSGSDRTDSEMLAKLRGLGAKVFVGHKATNVDNAELVVRTSAVMTDNVEIVEARRRGVHVVLREELLGAIVNNFPIRVCISGTHGKTTTTAMVSHVLRSVGMSHTAFIGGEYLGGNYLHGDNIVVCEACEYNRSFLQLQPTVAVCLNAEFDHPDCYADEQQTLTAFKQFVGSAHDGVAVLPTGLSGLCTSKSVLFGDCGDVVADNVVLQGGYPSFNLVVDGKFVAHCKLRVAGMHNVHNALCTFAVCKCLGVSLISATQALCTFRGVDRRWTEYPSARCRVVVDYAHHPTEIRASLATAQSMCKNTVCVFQPHTFSRTKAFMRQFAECFKGAAVVYLPIYPAREPPIQGVTSQALCNLAKEYGVEAYYAEDFAGAQTTVSKLLRDPADILLILGAGDVVNFATYYLKR